MQNTATFLDDDDKDDDERVLKGAVQLLLHSPFSLRPYVEVVDSIKGSEKKGQNRPVQLLKAFSRRRGWKVF